MEKTEAKPATSMVRPELSLTNVKKGFIADNFGLRPYMALLTVVLVALPAVVAYGIMYRQAINVPYQDDYNVILAFATDYHQLLSLKAKLVEISRPDRPTITNSSSRTRLSHWSWNSQVI